MVENRCKPAWLIKPALQLWDYRSCGCTHGVKFTPSCTAVNLHLLLFEDGPADHIAVINIFLLYLRQLHSLWLAGGKN